MGNVVMVRAILFLKQAQLQCVAAAIPWVPTAAPITSVVMVNAKTAHAVPPTETPAVMTDNAVVVIVLAPTTGPATTAGVCLMDLGARFTRGAAAGTAMVLRKPVWSASPMVGYAMFTKSAVPA